MLPIHLDCRKEANWNGVVFGYRSATDRIQAFLGSAGDEPGFDDVIKMPSELLATNFVSYFKPYDSRSMP